MSRGVSSWIGCAIVLPLMSTCATFAVVLYYTVLERHVYNEKNIWLKAAFLFFRDSCDKRNVLEIFFVRVNAMIYLQLQGM